MVWGFRHLDPLNQDGVNLIFDADFKGTPNYASGFELTPAAQNAILASCDILHNANATKISIDADTGNSTVMTACFMSPSSATASSAACPSPCRPPRRRPR